MEIAGIYCRISADREDEGLGVARQESDCRKLAERLGLTVFDVYVDDDTSASVLSTKPRPRYRDLLAHARLGKFQIILAYTTSRLTRRPREHEDLIDLSVQHGIKFHFVASPSFDLNTAAGREVARHMAARDTAEAEDIQERVLRKKLQDAREGKTSGGRRTYGYGLVIGHNPATSKDICDPYQVRDDEIEVLQEGKRRTLAGESQFTIMRDWKQRGVTTSLACSWTVGRFKRTLLNESYVQFDPTGHPTDCPCLSNPETGGTRIHRDERHRAKWPYIFTRAEHEAMSAVFNGRGIFWSNVGKLKGRTYLLSGIIYCGGTWRDTDRQGQLCNGYMYGQGKKENSRYIRRYACKKWGRDGDRCGCGTVFRIADAVEHYVTEQVLYRFDTPEVARALAPADNEERMSQVLQELAELQVRREQLAAEYAAGEHEKDDYRVMLRVVKENIAVLEAEKKQLVSVKAKSLAIPTDGGLRAVFNQASIEWQSSVIKLLVEKIIVHPGRSGKTMWPDETGWRFRPELIEIAWLH